MHDNNGLCIFDPERTLKIVPLDYKEPNSFISTHEQDVLKKQLLEKVDRLKIIENDTNRFIQAYIGQKENDFNNIVLMQSRGYGKKYGQEAIAEHEKLKTEIMDILEKLNKTFGIDWDGNPIEENNEENKITWE